MSNAADPAQRFFRSFWAQIGKELLLLSAESGFGVLQPSGHIHNLVIRRMNPGERVLVIWCIAFIALLFLAGVTFRRNQHAMRSCVAGLAGFAAGLLFFTWAVLPIAPRLYLFAFEHSPKTLVKGETLLFDFTVDFGVLAYSCAGAVLGCWIGYKYSRRRFTKT